MLMNSNEYRLPNHDDDDNSALAFTHENKNVMQKLFWRMSENDRIYHSSFVMHGKQIYARTH